MGWGPFDPETLQDQRGYKNLKEPNDYPDYPNIGISGYHEAFSLDKR